MGARFTPTLPMLTSYLKSPPVVHHTVGGLESTMGLDGRVGEIDHTTADVLG